MNENILWEIDLPTSDEFYEWVINEEISRFGLVNPYTVEETKTFIDCRPSSVAKADYFFGKEKGKVIVLDKKVILFPPYYVWKINKENLFTEEDVPELFVACSKIEKRDDGIAMIYQN